ncbi:MAG TPA: hypothetical protein PLP05_01280 [Sedimentisphaerales bacterium]|nr:hypothetical protein [Sedimentisphaerales bacterium]
MLSLKKLITFIIVCTWLCILVGCNESNKMPKMDSVMNSFSGPAEETAKIESNTAKYDQTIQVNDSIGSAVELSQKYAMLSEECVKLKEQNKNITEENQKIKANSDSLQTQLDQTKKELSEANDLLVEMRIELNNWKADILGFRDEMRNAQKAQLEALFKVLTILGGETGTPATETTTQVETVQKEIPLQQSIQTPNDTNNIADSNSQQENK